MACDSGFHPLGTSSLTAVLPYGAEVSMHATVGDRGLHFDAASVIMNERERKTHGVCASHPGNTYIKEIQPARINKTTSPRAYPLCARQSLASGRLVVSSP